MIAAHWPDWFRRKLGPAPWPRSYGCFDTETTGFRLRPDPNNYAPADLVTEFGWCLVVDGAVADKGGVLVDWTRHPGVSPDWLRQRLTARDRQMELNGGGPPTGYTTLAERGVPPAEAFGFAHAWFAKLAAAGLPVVAHNGYRFDEPMLAEAFRSTGVDPAWGFGPDRLIDTMAVERGTELWHKKPDRRPRLLPGPAETLRSYCTRVAAMQGADANLERHCFVKYGFEARGVRRQDLHGAEADAYCLTFLMDAWADQLAGRPPDPGPAAPPPAPPGPPPPPAPAGPARYRPLRIT